MSVVFTDTFTVGVDTNLNAYPATPDYSYMNGSGAQLLIHEDVDRVEPATGGVWRARLLNAAGPTGDQQTTVIGYWSGSWSGPLCMARCAAASDDGYYLYLDNAANEVVLGRYDAGVSTALATADRSLTAGQHTFRIKVTGAGATVSIEVQVDATTVLTYDDTSADRKTSGRAGLGGYNSTGTVWIDDLSIDDLAGGGSPQTLTGTPLIAALALATAVLVAGPATLAATPLIASASLPATTLLAETTVPATPLLLGMTLPVATLVPGAVTLTATALAATATLPTAVLSVGTQALTATPLTVAAMLPAATVSPGVAPLTATPLAGTVTMGGATLVPGGVILIATPLTLVATLPAAGILVSASLVATPLTVTATLPAVTLVPGGATLTGAPLILLAVLPTANLAGGAAWVPVRLSRAAAEVEISGSARAVVAPAGSVSGPSIGGTARRVEEP